MQRPSTEVLSLSVKLDSKTQNDQEGQIEVRRNTRESDNVFEKVHPRAGEYVFWLNVKGCAGIDQKDIDKESIQKGYGSP
jgi:hypothetical protein